MMNDSQKDINHRLKIAEGHLKKVVKMQEEGSYCIDVLHQLQAIRAAIGRIESKVLENHLKTCVRKAFSEGKQEKAIKEVLSVFDKTR